MSEEAVPATDMPDLFPPIENKVVPLPHAFDDSCKECETKMERVRPMCRTRRRPFAVFHCPKCNLRLMLFETAKTPLFLWSDSYGYVPDFSAMIDQKIEERERKRERQELRETGVLFPLVWPPD